MEYRFIDKDPVIDLIRTAIAEAGLYDNTRSRRSLCEKARIHPSTLDNILYGKTRHPQHRTVAAIFKALGIVTRRFWRDDGHELKTAQNIWRSFIKRQKERKVAA